MLERDGTLRILRWTTSITTYSDFGGWCLAIAGDAIWHRHDGPFTYGHMRLTQYEAP